MKGLLKLSTSVLFCILVAGCSRNAPPPSGFLGDKSIYNALRNHPKYEGIRVVRYVEPSTLQGSKYIIPPVKVYLNEQGQKRDIPAAELSELAIFLHNEVYEALGDDYKVTNVPGAEVNILRLAITDVDPNISLLNISPVTVLSGAGIGGATIEMAVEKSSTGQVLVAATASRSGARYKYTSGMSEWGHTKGVLRDFAQIIRERLDEIAAAEDSNS